MSDIRVRIYKQDRRSVILDESVTVFVDSKQLDGYVSLLRKTWPSTKIQPLKAA